MLVEPNNATHQAVMTSCKMYNLVAVEALISGDGVVRPQR